MFFVSVANQVGLEHVNFMTKTWKAMSWSIDNKGLESQVLNMLILWPRLGKPSFEVLVATWKAKFWRIYDDKNLESQVLNMLVVWTRLGTPTLEVLMTKLGKPNFEHVKSMS